MLNREETTMKHETMIKATADGEQIRLDFEGKAIDLLALAANMAWNLCGNCKVPVDEFCGLLKFVDEVYRSEGAMEGCTTIDLAAIEKMGGLP